MSILLSDVYPKQHIIDWIWENTPANKNDLEIFKNRQMMNDRTYVYSDIFANFIQLVLDNPDVRTIFYDNNINKNSIVEGGRHADITFDLCYEDIAYSFIKYSTGTWEMRYLKGNSASNIKKITLKKDDVSIVFRYIAFNADPEWFPEFKKEIMKEFGDFVSERGEVLEILDCHKLEIYGFNGTMEELEASLPGEVEERKPEPKKKEKEQAVSQTQTATTTFILGASPAKKTLIKNIIDGLSDNTHVVVPLTKGNRKTNYKIIAYCDGINLRIKGLVKGNKPDSTWECKAYMVQLSQVINEEFVSEFLDDLLFAMFGISPGAYEYDKDLFEEFF